MNDSQVHGHLLEKDDTDALSRPPQDHDINFNKIETVLYFKKKGCFFKDRAIFSL